MTGDTGSEQLDVVSIDWPVPGEMRLRVAAPVDDNGPVSLDQVSVTVAGQPMAATVRPVSADSMQVAVVIDVSGSMKGAPLAAAKESVARFVDQLPPTAQVSVVAFGPDVAVIQEATTDREAVLAAVRSLQAQGETSLYDGVLRAIQIPAQADRLPVVVLSDGGDTVSATGLDQLLSTVEAVPHRIYPIALGGEEGDRAILARLADASGGRMATTDNPAGLTELYDRLATSLAAEYEVSFPVSKEGPATIEISGAGTADGFGWSQVVDLPALPVELTRPDHASLQPATRVVPEPGLLAGPELLMVGAGLLGAALVAMIVVWLSGERSSSRLIRRDFRSKSRNQSVVLDRMRDGGVQLVEGAMKAGAMANLANQLDAAGVKMRVGELILMAAGLGVGLGVAGLGLAGPVGLAVGAVLGLFAPRVYLKLRQNRRSKTFFNQLPDILVALANVLRVGYSMNRGLAAVAREVEEPARSELNRAIMEARVGGDLISALRGVADRTRSKDLVWVVDAIEINSAVGGDMVGVLETVAQTVRSRVTLHAQVAALTAEGKMSALVLLILPPGLTVFIAVSNPAYFDGIWVNPLAYWMAGAAVAFLVIGGLWIRKMIAAVA